ncbi:MAG: FG-GAP-like repeat-containing protein [Candidatus Eisenbacteria bacterium]
MRSIVSGSGSSRRRGCGRQPSRVATHFIRALLWCAFMVLPARAQFVQQGSKLVPPDALGPALFGAASAISADGNTAIFGGTRDNTNDGAIWIYVRQAGVWIEQAKRSGPAAAGLPTFFGASVALSADGNTAIVGSPDADGFIGAAWVYVRSGTSWSLQQKLVGTGGVGYPGQGHSVALSADGNTALVGGPADDDPDAIVPVNTSDRFYGTGAVWVWTRSGGVWTQQGPKLGRSPAVQDHARFGQSVALSDDGSVALIGASSLGNFAADEQLGAAYVFKRDGVGNWSQAAELAGNDVAGTFVLQGISVDLSADGTTAVVGGLFDQPYGAAWIYQETAGLWAQQGPKLATDEGDGASHTQGNSVAISADGNSVFIGSPNTYPLLSNDPIFTGAGEVLSYARSGSTWSIAGPALVGTGATEVSTNPPGEHAGRGSSTAVSADGNTVLVTAVNDDWPGVNFLSHGAAWVFVRSLPPQLQSLSQASGAPGTNVTLSVQGSGLLPGASIKLTRLPSPEHLGTPSAAFDGAGTKLAGLSGAEILGSSVSVAPDGASISASFDLAGAALGAWDVVVTNPFAQQSTLAGSFLVSEAAFTRLLGGPLSFTGNGAGAAWGDIDGDGDPDLYQVTYGQANRLLRNDGANAFTDITTPVVATAGPFAFTGDAVWGDVDNDGDLDLFHTYNEVNALARNDGAGAFTDLTSAVLRDLAPSQQKLTGAWADFDNDGDLDVYVAEHTGPGSHNSLFRNDAGVFVNATPALLAGAGGNQVHWTDVDGDGDLDLAVMREAGGSAIYSNEGSGIFLDATPAGAFASASGAVWGDFDNDGDPDAYLQATSPNGHLLVNDGAGGFAESVAGALPCARAETAAWADYDNDGDLDLYVGRVGSNQLFRNDAGVFADVTIPSLAGEVVNSTTSTTWADTDGDGDLDLYVTNYGPGNRLLRNDLGTSAHWLRVRLVGSSSNRFGIGARVRVVAGGLDQTRDLVASAKGTSETAYLAHFGLGANATATLIEVRWPSGYVQSIAAPTAADQVVTITEPAVIATALLSLFPANHVNTGTAAVTLLGRGLVAGTDVRLVRAGSADIVGTGVASSFGGSQLEVSFDMTGAAIGAWDVIATSPGGSVGRRTHGFRVLGTGEVAFTEAGGGDLSRAANDIGSAWGDMDADGDLDLFRHSYAQFTALLRNDGLTGFPDATDPDLTSDLAVAFSQAARWGDYDNDGDLDLLRMSTEAFRLYRNDGGGNFADITSALFPAQSSEQHHSGGFADYDNDGDLDVFVGGHFGSPNRLYRNDGAAFTSVPLGPAADLTAVLSEWIDVDSDGDLDLCIMSNLGPSGLFRNDGAGVFSDITPPAGVLNAPLGLWADYDQDGDADIYVASGTSGARLLQNDGSGSFTEVSAGALPAADATSGAWEDFDNDGDLDLMLGRIGANQLLRNDDGVFTDVTVAPLDGLVVENTNATVWGDYDGDGDQDLYVANGSSPGASNHLLRNDLGTGAHWLRVRLQGQLSNRGGIGARVRIVAGGRQQVRWLTSAAGGGSQSALEACFGLGSESSAEQIEVRWPSGIVQVVSTPTLVDQVLVLTEPLANHPLLHTLSLAVGGNGGSTTVTLYGLGIPFGSQLKLALAGEADIPGTDVRFTPDLQGVIVTFDLRRAVAGLWDIVLTTPDLQTAAMPAAFRVEQVLSAQLRVDILGPDLVRANIPAPYDIVVTNEGNTDATVVPVWLTGIPAGVTIEPDFAVPAPPGRIGEPDWSAVPLVSSTSAGQYVSLVIPRVPPGVVTRRVYLTLPLEVPSLDLRGGTAMPWNVNPAALQACLADTGVVRNSACMTTGLPEIADSILAHPEVAAFSGVAFWSQEAFRCELSGSLPAAQAAAEEVLGRLAAPFESEGLLPASCDEVAGPRWRTHLAVNVVGAIDPNEKVGPSSTISPGNRVTYDIFFENLPTATGAAQRVRVLDPLDLSKFDIHTVVLSSFSVGDRVIDASSFTNQGAVDVPMPERNLNLHVSYFRNDDTGLLQWDFVAQDLLTKAPISPHSLNGFLPPNTGIDGTGSVTFSVSTRRTLSPGTPLSNTATITFDSNRAISTQPFLVDVTATAVASHVLPLPTTQDSLAFTVRWEPLGDPASIKDFTVYYSDNDSNYTVWAEKENTPNTVGLFRGQQGHHYKFFSVARDSFQTFEEPPPAADAQTQAGVLAVDGDVKLQLALEGALPNPARSVIRASFSLPVAGSATLELLDVGGRRVARRVERALPAGRHLLEVGQRGRIAPGQYWLRLLHGGRVLTRRVTLLD